MATVKQTEVITALVTGSGIAQAAQRSHVNERTVYRWLRLPAFQDALRQEERLVLNACSWRLVALTKKALDALEDVLERPYQPGAANKRLAAGAIVELAGKYYEQVVLEDRVSHLEEMVLK